MRNYPSDTPYTFILFKDKSSILLRIKVLINLRFNQIKFSLEIFSIKIWRIQFAFNLVFFSTELPCESWINANFLF